MSDKLSFFVPKQYLGPLIDIKRGLSWDASMECAPETTGARPVLRIPNVKEHLDLTDLVYLKRVSAFQGERFSASKGWTILVGSNGNPDRVGNPAFIEEDQGYLFASFLMGIAPAPSAALDAKFLFHYIRSDAVQQVITNSVQGSTGLKNLRQGVLYNLPIPKFNLAEQCRIAEVLDTADEAIRQTEALIAKLKQMKQGLLHDLLTRGLDENGALRDPVARPDQFKDSPIGRIPREWRCIRLVDTAAQSIHSFVDGDWIESPWISTSGIRLVQTGNVGIGEFLDKPDSRRFISERTFRELACKWVCPGDILICRLADPIGRACSIPKHVGACITAVDCTIYRPEPTMIRSGYVLEYLNSPSHLQSVMDSAGGSTRQRISRANLGKTRILVPSLGEQERIELVLSAHNEGVRTEEAYRDKLQLLKKGLMLDLLTGRVRVPVPDTEPQPIEVGA